MHAYLIRYGTMSRIGQFWSEAAGLARGQAVVIRTHRGTELGEVLLDVPQANGAPPAVGSAAIVRLAAPEDHEAARRAADERHARFAACVRIFEDGVWPIELIDAEPLLDDGRTVLHYLGPHDLDSAGLRAIVRDRCGFDVVLEPVGRDAPHDEEHADSSSVNGHGCGSCGGSGGGCGPGGCSTAAEGQGGGCGDCGVKKLLAGRRVPAAL
jgi:hypothetical protein